MDIENKNKLVIFIAGECPVTPGAEYLAILLKNKNKEPIFYCYGCGSTWPEHPNGEVKKMYSLEDLALEGIIFPTIREIKNLELIDRVTEVVPYTSMPLMFREDIEELNK